MLKLNRGYYYPQQRLLLSSAEAIIILNGRLLLSSMEEIIILNRGYHYADFQLYTLFQQHTRTANITFVKVEHTKIIALDYPLYLFKAQCS